MKKIKKIISVILAVIMAFTMMVPVFAADEDAKTYTETAVDFDNTISAAKAEKLANDIGNIVLAALAESNGTTPSLVIEKFLNEKLYTNATAGAIIQAALKALGNLNDMLSSKPKDLADTLEEEKFAGAQSKLKGRRLTWDDEFTFESGDWGFEDGDKNGFVDAVSTMLRAVPAISMAIKFSNGYSFDGYNGAYERLLSIFEVLELDGVITSEEYTANFEYMYPRTYEEMDNCLRPILNIVVKLLDKLAADPVNTIMDLLPKFAYALDSGIINDCIHEITNNVAFIGSIDIPDINVSTIYNAVAPKLENIAVGEETVSITLDEEAFNKLFADLAGCGKAETVESITLDAETRLAITSDKAKTTVVILNYLVDTVKSGDNMAAVKALVNGLELSGSIKSLVKIALFFVKVMPKKVLYSAISVVLTIANMFLTLKNIFKK